MDLMTIVFLVGGILILIWSLNLFRNPESLSPDSMMYKWIYMQWTSSAWQKDSDFANPDLSYEQIRRYAIIGFVVSGVLILVGLWGVVDML